MLKTILSNGHSSQVRGWLLIDRVQHELAQVGPDFCIVRDSISISSSSTFGELIVEVDGNQQSFPVQFATSQPGSTKRVSFTRT